MDSHEVVGKGYVNIKNSLITSIGTIFTSTYHSKQLKPWPSSSASRVVNYSQLPACQGIWTHLKATWALIDVQRASETSHSKSTPGNFQHQYLPELFSQCVLLSFDGEKYVLLLNVWKLAFLKSGHICSLFINQAYISLRPTFTWFF